MTENEPPSTFGAGAKSNIIVREIISDASGALDKIWYESTTGPDKMEAEPEFFPSLPLTSRAEPSCSLIRAPVLHYGLINTGDDCRLRDIPMLRMPWLRFVTFRVLH